MSAHCPRCGATYEGQARFCTVDGARLTPRATRSRSGATGPPATPGIDVTDMTGRTLDGRYRVVARVGEGGMAYVYLAEDAATGQWVAIKVLTPALASDRIAVARLRREAALGQRLAHPNVCQIMRLGETESGFLYVVMPFLDGELLCDRTQALGQLPLPQAVKLVGDIAAGLHAAHELEIIHRDLKPENIMLCRSEDGAERAVVLDFGLAKERRVTPELAKLTNSGVVLGTPEFMSPEQLRCKPLDARSDIYSLGLITCEMLTGGLPFAGRTQQDVMVARLRGDPIPIRQMRPDLDFPAAVERVLLTCLRPDPEERYRTAPAFAAALAAAAARGSRDVGLLSRLRWR